VSSSEEARISSLDAVLDETPHSDQIAGELFGVVDALDSSAILRRSLTDPNVADGDRQGLAAHLLRGRVSEATLEVIHEAVGGRWPGGRTLAAALERQAVRAELARAQAAGQLDETEDSLFRFARLVDSFPELRNTLADRRMPIEARQSLVGELLEGRAGPATTELAKRAVVARERTFGNTIEGYVTLAAAQQNRVVATVRVARPLSEEQTHRLRATLSKQAGREVAIQEIVEPKVLGGIRVELGDQVIEGTVESRLDEAKRLFG
jgi:F-type H+-transporting ATPase subunit delta